MNITCTGPNGITFHAEGANWVGGDGIRTRLRNDSDREAMQKALVTWCEAFGVAEDKTLPQKSQMLPLPETTKERTTMPEEPDHKFLEELCDHCNVKFGLHRATDGQCPKPFLENAGSEGWLDTQFRLKQE